MSSKGAQYRKHLKDNFPARFEALKKTEADAARARRRAIKSNWLSGNVTLPMEEERGTEREKRRSPPPTMPLSPATPLPQSPPLPLEIKLGNFIQVFFKIGNYVCLVVPPTVTDLLDGDLMVKYLNEKKGYFTIGKPEYVINPRDPNIEQIKILEAPRMDARYRIYFKVPTDQGNQRKVKTHFQGLKIRESFVRSILLEPCT